jgi:threonine/homoserine/homoserine lactone efflux protein
VPAATAETLALGGLFIAVGMVWICGYALVVASVAGQLRRPRVRRAIDAVSGTVLVALGIRVAAEAH